MYKVITIDDERSIRDSFKLALEYVDGVEVYEAENGLEGLNLVKKVQPDLVFLDLKMPVMNGAEVLEEIRKLYPDVPIYVVTAFVKEFFEELQALNEKGLAFEVATKPLSMKQIQELVRVVLNLPGNV
jgi:two-component system response regulator YesN